MCQRRSLCLPASKGSKTAGEKPLFLDPLAVFEWSAAQWALARLIPRSSVVTACATKESTLLSREALMTPTRTGFCSRKTLYDALQRWWSKK